MSYKIPFIQFEQNKQTYLMAVMPFKCVFTYSKVLVYDVDPDGYQRKPEPKHYNKIRDYVLKNINTFILPTSVILGIDSDDFKKIKTTISSKDILDFNAVRGKDAFLRIVDGQHRIAGLREAARQEPSINDYSIPVIIVITSVKKRSKELEIFSDINSKAKRVKVDLIQLASYEYRLKEESISEANIAEHICIKSAYILKEDSDKSIWHNAIKFDIHNEYILGIVGVNLFVDSVLPIVKTYIRSHEIDLKTTHKKLLEYVNKAGDEISKLLFSSWDNIIKVKWPDAFDSKQIEMDIDEELRTYYYKKDYYVQKSLGVKVINGIISDFFKENNSSVSKTLSSLRPVIMNSKIKNEDWKMGGFFSGFSSESGVNKVKQLIMK